MEPSNVDREFVNAVLESVADGEFTVEDLEGMIYHGSEARSHLEAAGAAIAKMNAGSEDGMEDLDDMIEELDVGLASIRQAIVELSA